VADSRKQFRALRGDAINWGVEEKYAAW
jgi:hypothetical protein